MSLSIVASAKFKRALRLHFLTHFTKNFFCFLTPKVKSGTDMINPSIESSDFLFCHKKIFELDFWRFCWKQGSNLVCVYTHLKFQNMKFSLSVSHKIFKNPTQKFSNAKKENQSFRLMGSSYLCHFYLSVWESGKSFL